eukprot:g428.t1
MIMQMMVIPRDKLAREMMQMRQGRKVMTRFVLRMRARRKARLRREELSKKSARVEDKALALARNQLFDPRAGGGDEGGGGDDEQEHGSMAGRMRPAPAALVSTLKGDRKQKLSRKQKRQYVALELLKEHEGDGSIRDTLDRAYGAVAAHHELEQALEQEKQAYWRQRGGEKRQSGKAPEGDGGEAETFDLAAGAAGGDGSSALAATASLGHGRSDSAWPIAPDLAPSSSSFSRGRPIVSLSMSAGAQQHGAMWESGQVAGTLALSLRPTRQRASRSHSHSVGAAAAAFCKYTNCTAVAIAGNYGYCSAHRLGHGKYYGNTARDGGAVPRALPRFVAAELAHATELRNGRRLALSSGDGLSSSSGDGDGGGAGLVASNAVVSGGLSSTLVRDIMEWRDTPDERVNGSTCMWHGCGQERQVGGGKRSRYCIAHSKVMDLSSWTAHAKGELLLKMLHLDEENASQSEMKSFLAAMAEIDGGSAAGGGGSASDQMVWPFDTFATDMRRLAARPEFGRSRQRQADDTLEPSKLKVGTEVQVMVEVLLPPTANAAGAAGTGGGYGNQRPCRRMWLDGYVLGRSGATPDQQEQAVLLLQGQTRALYAKREVATKKKEKKAAVVIQASVRRKHAAYEVRQKRELVKKYGDANEERTQTIKQEEEHSVTIIQTKARQRAAQKEVQALKEAKEEAAKKVQDKLEAEKAEKAKEAVDAKAAPGNQKGRGGGGILGKKRLLKRKKKAPRPHLRDTSEHVFDVALSAKANALLDLLLQADCQWAQQARSLGVGGDGGGSGGSGGGDETVAPDLGQQLEEEKRLLRHALVGAMVEGKPRVRNMKLRHVDPLLQKPANTRDKILEAIGGPTKAQGASDEVQRRWLWQHGGEHPDAEGECGMGGGGLGWLSQWYAEGLLLLEEWLEEQAASVDEDNKEEEARARAWARAQMLPSRWREDFDGLARLLETSVDADRTKQAIDQQMHSWQSVAVSSGLKGLKGTDFLGRFVKCCKQRLANQQRSCTSSAGAPAFADILSDVSPSAAAPNSSRLLRRVALARLRTPHTGSLDERPGRAGWGGGSSDGFSRHGLPLPWPRLPAWITVARPLAGRAKFDATRRLMVELRSGISKQQSAVRSLERIRNRSLQASAFVRFMVPARDPSTEYKRLMQQLQNPSIEYKALMQGIQQQVDAADTAARMTNAVVEKVEARIRTYCLGGSSVEPGAQAHARVHLDAALEDGRLEAVDPLDPHDPVRERARTRGRGGLIRTTGTAASIAVHPNDGRFLHWWLGRHCGGHLRNKLLPRLAPLVMNRSRRELLLAAQWVTARGTFLHALSCCENVESAVLAPTDPEAEKLGFDHRHSASNFNVEQVAHIKGMATRAAQKLKDGSPDPGVLRWPAEADAGVRLVHYRVHVLLRPNGKMTLAKHKNKLKLKHGQHPQKREHKRMLGFRAPSTRLQTLVQLHSQMHCTSSVLLRPQLVRMEILELEGNDIGPTGFAALAGGLRLRRFSHGSISAEPDGECEFGSTLLRLSLRANPIGRSARGPSFDRTPEAQAQQLKSAAETALRKVVKLAAFSAGFRGCKAMIAAGHARPDGDPTTDEAVARMRSMAIAVEIAAGVVTTGSDANTELRRAAAALALAGASASMQKSFQSIWLHDPESVMHAIARRDERTAITADERDNDDHDGDHIKPEHEQQTNPLAVLMRRLTSSSDPLDLTTLGYHGEILPVPPLPELLLSLLVQTVSVAAAAAAEAGLRAQAAEAAVGIAPALSSGSGGGGGGSHRAQQGHFYTSAAYSGIPGDGDATAMCGDILTGIPVARAAVDTEEEGRDEGTHVGTVAEAEASSGWSEVERLEAERLQLLREEYRRGRRLAVGTDGQDDADEEDADNEQDARAGQPLPWKEKTAHGTWMSRHPPYAPSPTKLTTTTEGSSGSRMKTSTTEQHGPLLKEQEWAYLERLYTRQLQRQHHQLCRLHRGCGVGELLEWCAARDNHGDSHNHNDDAADDHARARGRGQRESEPGGECLPGVEFSGPGPVGTAATAGGRDMPTAAVGVAGQQ